MQTLPLNTSQSQTLEALQRFLEGCKWQADSKNHKQLVSITLEANALDPLAVLESIYESEELHFYVERPYEDFAMAGAEAVLHYCPSGPSRFSDAKAFICETLDNTIAVGNADLPFFGPHFFCSFSFFAEVREESPFPSASIFVPRWQVSVAEGRCVANANAVIDVDSNIDEIAQRIWNANTKFNSFDYSEVDPSIGRTRSDWKLVEEKEKGGSEAFGSAIRNALDGIEKGEIEKIVLARALDLQANQAFHPLEILNALRERFPDCFSFSTANGNGQSFIGASPERMVRLKAGKLATEALAGSAPRGLSAAEDAQLGGALLKSEKDRREHDFVLRSTCKRLKGLGIAVETDESPRLKRLVNVQHLRSSIEGNVPGDIHLLDIVDQLHPTPAVGGTPREKAQALIPSLENFERGLYAGPIGWVDSKGEGDFLVSIRSALIDGKQAQLYAGAGIVEGSVPEKEIQETNWKFKALMENLL